MYDRVLIAVDGSDEARRAARRGLRLAQGFGATVDLLSVVEQRALRLTETADEETPLRERGEEALAAVEAFASELGQPVNTKLTEGMPAVEISECADEMGYFDSPRRAGGGAVAAELDISQATFSEHLGVAQRKLLDQLLASD